jgi:hypothetical protein
MAFRQRNVGAGFSTLLLNECNAEVRQRTVSAQVLTLRNENYRLESPSNCRDPKRQLFGRAGTFLFFIFAGALYPNE